MAQWLLAVESCVARASLASPEGRYSAQPHRTLNPAVMSHNPVYFRILRIFLDAIDRHRLVTSVAGLRGENEGLFDLVFNIFNSKIIKEQLPREGREKCI